MLTDVDHRNTLVPPSELAQLRQNLPYGARLRRGWTDPTALFDRFAVDEVLLLPSLTQQTFVHLVTHALANDLRALALKRRDTEQASLLQSDPQLGLPAVLRVPPRPSFEKLYATTSSLLFDPWVDPARQASELPVASSFLAGTVATWFHDGDEAPVLDLERHADWVEWTTTSTLFSPRSR